MTPRYEQPTPGPAMQLAEKINSCVPVITTDRFTLRAPVLSDFPACAEIIGDERGRFIGGPLNRDDAWFEFTAMVSGWMLHGHGGFTIEDRATGDAMGFVMLGLEPGDREVELGFALTQAAEGKGVAHECARAVRNWAEQELNLTGLVSYIDPKNTRSVALAGRLGATRDAAAEAEFDDGTCVYRHPKPETV